VDEDVLEVGEGVERIGTELTPETGLLKPPNGVE